MKPFDWIDAPAWVEKRSLYVVRAGSHAYGTALPESDTDYRGVFVHPLDQYLGTVKRPADVIERKSEGLDIELREVRQFLRLVAGGNPNVVEMLFVEPEDILERHALFAPIFERRQEFLTPRLYNGLRGFAYQAFLRFNTGKDAEEKQWKLAAQAVRLSRMAEELLLEQVLRVRRPDAWELLQLRRGCAHRHVVYRELSDTFLCLDDIAMRKIRDLPQDASELLHILCAELVRDFTADDEI